MEEKLQLFSKWLNDTYKIKAIITNDRKNISYGEFCLFIKEEEEFEIFSHDTVSSSIDKKTMMIYIKKYLLLNLTKT